MSATESFLGQAGWGVQMSPPQAGLPQRGWGSQHHTPALPGPQKLLPRPHPLQNSKLAPKDSQEAPPGGQQPTAQTPFRYTAPLVLHPALLECWSGSQLPRVHLAPSSLTACRWVTLNSVYISPLRPQTPSYQFLILSPGRVSHKEQSSLRSPVGQVHSP